jgi:hypothetical protein
MKNVIVLLAALVAGILSYGQTIDVVQINAEWNDASTRRDLARLSKCNYTFGYLESQSKELRDQISAVPVVLIYKDNVLVKIYQAGIDLQLKVELAEIQEYIYLLKNN